MLLGRPSRKQGTVATGNLEPVESMKLLLNDRRNGNIPSDERRKLHEKRNVASRKLHARKNGYENEAQRAEKEAEEYARENERLEMEQQLAEAEAWRVAETAAAAAAGKPTPRSSHLKRIQMLWRR